MKNLTIGIGCRRGVSTAQIAAAVRAAMSLVPWQAVSQASGESAPAQQDPAASQRADDGWRQLLQDRVRCVATVEDKADETGLLEFCAAHGLALQLYSRRAIAEYAEYPAEIPATDPMDNPADKPFAQPLADDCAGAPADEHAHAGATTARAPTALTRGACAALSPPSAAVRTRFGLEGICEPCALLAAAPRGQLLVPKRAQDGVTVAVARVDQTQIEPLQ